MNDITVRKVDFDFPEDAGLYAIPSLPRVSLFIAAFSLTMPYLEPYLIRMMLKATDEIDDPALLDDIKKFSQQEGNHYRNHARINKIVRSHFDKPTQDRLLEIEADLKADYDLFLQDKPLAFNLAYAEGFEAMTCAAALPMVRRDPAPGMSREWQELLAWHALEEVEHRTVAFDTYQHIVGSYPYRIWQGARAQIHYLRFIHRFYRVMLKAKGFRLYPYIPLFILGGGLRYVNTFMPWYNPANYKVPTNFEQKLAVYDAMTK